MTELHELAGSADDGYEPRPGLTHRDADWSGLRVLVAGLGISGFAAADALWERGAIVTVVDASAPGASRAVDERTQILTVLGVDVRLGVEHTQGLPTDRLTDLVVTSPGWRPSQPLLAEAAARGIPVWGEVELAWRMRPAQGAAPWLTVTGTNGKTTTVNMLASILRAAGLSYQSLGKVEYLPFGESVELMKNRQLDVTLQSAGLGVSSIRDLATSVKIVIVPIPADVIAKIGNAAYQQATIPAGTYEGQTADTPTAAVPNFLVTASTVPDDLVYQMTKVFYEQLDTLKSAHNAAKTIQLDNALKGMPVPLHPGAERYYKEVGLIK